jgi:glycosyltransferase involved in cell wall biosynthesis
LNQTFVDLEIIAVNDGSNDGSGIILNEMALTDKRLRVFHTPNRGVSAARNFGIE